MNNFNFDYKSFMDQKQNILDQNLAQTKKPKSIANDIITQKNNKCGKSKKPTNLVGYSLVMLPASLSIT